MDDYSLAQKEKAAFVLEDTTCSFLFVKTISEVLNNAP